MCNVASGVPEAGVDLNEIVSSEKTATMFTFLMALVFTERQMLLRTAEPSLHKE